jgi:hypothetical protein
MLAGDGELLGGEEARRYGSSWERESRRLHSGKVVQNEMVVGLEWWRSMTTGMMQLNFGAARSREGVEAKNSVE